MSSTRDGALLENMMRVPQYSQVTELASSARSYGAPQLGQTWMFDVSIGSNSTSLEREGGFT
jgi:hypothetical protein